MKKKTRVSICDEIALNVRREWGFNPCSKAFKSKKVYNRKNTSWKKELD